MQDGSIYTETIINLVYVNMQTVDSCQHSCSGITLTKNNFNNTAS